MIENKKVKKKKEIKESSLEEKMAKKEATEMKNSKESDLEEKTNEKEATEMKNNKESILEEKGASRYHWVNYDMADKELQNKKLKKTFISTILKNSVATVISYSISAMASSYLPDFNKSKSKIALVWAIVSRINIVIGATVVSKIIVENIDQHPINDLETDPHYKLYTLDSFTGEMVDLYYDIKDVFSNLKKNSNF